MTNARRAIAACMNTLLIKPATRPRFSLRLLLIVISLLAVVLAFWVGPVTSARNRARCMQAMNDVKQIGLALTVYYNANGEFPPSVEYDATAQPMLSWRVSISPFLESSDFYSKYDRTLPWDSPGNDALCRTYNYAKHIYAREGVKNRDAYCANFVVVTGPGTLFPLGESKTLADITDGPENTIMLVEIDNSNIHWHEPRDLDIATMSFRINDPDRSKPCIGNRKSQGVLVGMCDGSVQFLPNNTPPETLKAMLTIAGGERIPNWPRDRE